MNRLVKYFDEVNAQYVIHNQTALKNEEIPAAMREFYQTFECVDLPYGRIYDVDTACRQSQRAPFSPDWFVFGQDNYFCFWLCRRGETDDGLYFTYWDHESGTGIEEPVWADLFSFLREVQEENQ